MVELRKAFLLAFVLVSLALSILDTGLMTTASGSKTLHVYPGESIQEGVNSCQLGDTIFVHAGTYVEHVVINKTLLLVGENKDNTIIDGSEIVTPVVHITANNVTVTAFTIQNGGRIYGLEGGGIYVTNSSRNNIINNTIRNTQYGINLKNSTNNIITGNTLKENDVGIQFIDNHSNNNIIYHNNLIDNGWQVNSFTPSNNIWDNCYPSGGNYWSDYTSTDFYNGPYQNETGSDGIGDNPYVIDTNNQDNYHLMGMFYDFTVEIELGQIRHVRVISNSTVSNLEVRIWLSSPKEYIQTGDKFIYYFVDGEEGSVGFCRIMIPRVVLNDSYVVLVDWHEVSATELPFSNGTHAYLYFTYNHSTHEVVIVPEFPTWTATLLIFIVLTVATAISKRRLLKTPIH